MKSKLLFFFLFSVCMASAQNEIPLSPCPNSPNCVSTIESKRSKKMTPLSFKGSLEESKAKLKTILSETEGTTIVEESPAYLHVEFTAKPGKFVDDVEFYFSQKEKKIHFRSASRVGYGDFGANKRRMKKISKNWKLP